MRLNPLTLEMNNGECIPIICMRAKYMLNPCALPMDGSRDRATNRLMLSRPRFVYSMSFSCIAFKMPHDILYPPGGLDFVNGVFENYLFPWCLPLCRQFNTSQPSHHQS